MEEIKAKKTKAPAKPRKTAAKKTTAAPVTDTALTNGAAHSNVTEMKPSHDQVAKLAHRYWAERGGQHGHHVEDWLRAEHELRGKAS
jgi:hypothetical protein